MSKLYESDLQAVCSNGCTLLMVAAMHGQEGLVKQLLKRDVPIDFKQIKVDDKYCKLLAAPSSRTF